jgi:CDGSH-type Zn-finger protein
MRSFVARRLYSSFVLNKAELVVKVHPTVAKKGPIKTDLKQGETYYWCTCGKSAKQPFCDGSHKDSDFKPLQFVWDQPDKANVSLCGCKLN